MKFIMSKKIIAFVLSLILILAFTGCAENKDNNSSAVITSTSADDKTSETKSEVSEKVSQNGDVLLDNEYCKIIFNNLEYTEDDVRMHLSVQNKMDDELGITVKNFATNGIMSGLSEERNLEASQTEDILCFIGYDYHTVDCGIENKDFSIVEFDVELRNTENYKVFYEETYVLYPLGEDAVQKTAYVPADSDVILLDNDVCKISFIKGEKEDSAYYLYLYIENKTDETLAFEFKKSKVNGISTSVTDSIPKITAKNAIYYTPSFWQLKEDGISEVETIEMPVIAYYMDDFTAPAVEETFTIIP